MPYAGAADTRRDHANLVIAVPVPLVGARTRSAPRRTLPAALALALVTACVVASLQAAPVFIDGSLERLFEGASAAEGPAPHPDGFVYFTDITTTVGRTEKEFGRLWRYAVDSGRTELFLTHAGQPNGMVVDRRGDLLVAQAADWGGRRIVRIDPATLTATLVAGSYDGAPFNAPNDIAMDAAGRFYFTDPRYIGHEPIEQDAFGVYRIDPDGTVTRLVHDLRGPNGVALHPDGGTLYVTEYDVGFHALAPFLDGSPRPAKGAMQLLAWDLDEQGNVANRRVVLDFGDDWGMDGLAVDAAGRIFGAVRSDARHGIGVYSPKGQELDFLPLPEKPSNVAFGVTASDLDALYITTRSSLFRARYSPPTSPSVPIGNRP